MGETQTNLSEGRRRNHRWLDPITLTSPPPPPPLSFSLPWSLHSSVNVLPVRDATGSAEWQTHKSTPFHHVPHPILGLSNQTAPCPLVPTECVSVSHAEWQAYYKPLQSLVSKLPWDDELSVSHMPLKPSTNGSEGQQIMNLKYGIWAHMHNVWSYPPYHPYYL